MNVMFSSTIPATLALLKSFLLLSLSAAKYYSFPMLLMLWFHFWIFFGGREGRFMLRISSIKPFHNPLCVKARVSLFW